MSNQNGTLYVVATPIGNLEDMTHRAVRILSEVDYILCEDTRVTGKLLKHYGITTKMKRYDAHASEKTHADILTDLAAGKHLALVSDAGTPGVSDPGVLLIQKIRTVRHRMSDSSEGGVGGMNEIKIEAIPGPSAVTAAISIAGLSGNQFSFLGFVPHKKGRQTFFTELVAYTHPVVFFESTHRIMKTLQSLHAVANQNSNVNITIYVGRELTKMHEEMLVGRPQELLTFLQENPVKQKGEFVIIFTLAHPTV